MKDSIRATDIHHRMDYLEAAAASEWEAWDALPRVTTPTLFLTGELEDPKDSTAKAAAKMPNGIGSGCRDWATSMLSRAPTWCCRT